MAPACFEGTGTTIEEALDAAHMQIPIPVGSDITVSRVVDWGMQYGGFIPQRTFWVIVEEDPNGTHPLNAGAEPAGD
ncbi:hypothetical protein BV98_001521 [Sphingobium herbicidovorans NBRC 16415]|uniref:Uncharacterized protein n=1 Tax=Sphingobium herbicidovorans (strain ATCC 700291 / DSM 11019 / CCUG 56400 / KCTC 2939 / LMG 18315 / NBRC 16415 / MH) TaxID=1219045 RepID=A0A086PAA1_SPHHM|nr:hypothetical protein [Sphingobium herbicidovorans]KFG90319.1 hypothetical protein BV98_001521 [Sphingobium herbicidovorans NBRC 16415]